MIEGLDQEVEAQVRHNDKAGGSGDNDIVINSDSELSQLHSSDFKGIEF